MGKEVRVPHLPNARWIKYLNVEKEFIKVAEENTGKYLNNLASIKCFFFLKNTVRNHKNFITLKFNSVHQNNTTENQKANDKLEKHL